MKPDLRPCPFCGGKAELWKAWPEKPKRGAWIACMDRCAVMTKEYETNEEAVAVWNSRVSDDMLDALKAFDDCFVVAGGMPFDDDAIIEMVRAAIAKIEGHS